MTPTDKRYDEYRMKCADVDGILKIYTADDGVLRGNYKPDDLRYFQIDIRVPTYLDDASIDAVVRKLDDKKLKVYWTELLKIILPSGLGNIQEILKATPEQKAEALARTLIGGEE